MIFHALYCHVNNYMYCAVQEEDMCLYLPNHVMNSLQAKTVNELGQIFSALSDVLETAAAMSDPLKGRSHVIQELERLRETMRIPASNGRKSDGKRAAFMNWGMCSQCTKR